MSQHLKNHADMGSVHATDLKIVQEHHGALAQFIVGVRVTHALQELDLVERGFGVVRCALDNLKRDKLFLREVPA